MLSKIQGGGPSPAFARLRLYTNSFELPRTEPLLRSIARATLPALATLVVPTNFDPAWRELFPGLTIIYT